MQEGALAVIRGIDATFQVKLKVVYSKLAQINEGSQKFACLILKNSMLP
tara:strand:+ start:447 stop:593 length:147 start_codon:yes stop_codon:yes gene_type:complete